MAESAVATDAAGYRPLLFSIAYGMTGSVGDDEDIVQDALLGLTRADRAGTTITNLKAYLTTSVTRLGINHLTSARVRRETYMGEWLPEPVVVTADHPGPAEHTELADALSMAFLVLLEALSPTERAVFMLREAFGYGYPEIADAVGKSEANCRQILTRARKRLTPSPQPVDTRARKAEADELARRFFDATEGGDLDALLQILSPDIAFHGDGGGKARALGKTLTGLRRVAQLLIGGLRRNRKLGVTLTPATVNGRPGAAFYDTEGRIAGVLELDIADGAIRAVHSVSNPDKLTHLGPVSDIALVKPK
ncbi:RNA polymerase sigma factor SigJ [Kitasatospora sp. NPDC058478]|uniref:RNA polymerase sigma factor SigJ n=1 Tax=unclassified Kitasatospora TaxID=2633591 RepID=UPI003656E86E